MKKILFLFLFLFSVLVSNAQTLKNLNWKSTPSGLQYYIPFRSINDTVVPMKTVVVKYITIMDENTKAVLPDSDNMKEEEVKLNEMIVGFAHAVRMLSQGEEGFFKVPPELAYGNQTGEYKDTIFYFYIKLIEVKN